MELAWYRTHTGLRRRSYAVLVPTPAGEWRCIVRFLYLLHPLLSYPLSLTHTCTPLLILLPPVPPAGARRTLPLGTPGLLAQHIMATRASAWGGGLRGGTHAHTRQVKSSCVGDGGGDGRGIEGESRAGVRREARENLMSHDH